MEERKGVYGGEERGAWRRGKRCVVGWLAGWLVGWMVGWPRHAGAEAPIGAGAYVDTHEEDLGDQEPEMADPLTVLEERKGVYGGEERGVWGRGKEYMEERKGV